MKPEHDEEAKIIQDAINNGYPIMNWPPSRGPMPAWMEHKPVIKVPKVELVELQEGAEPPIRVVQTEVPNDMRFSEFRTTLELERNWTYSDLGVLSVEEMLSASAQDATNLVRGVRGLHPIERRGRGQPSERKTCDNLLPVRTVVVDLDYPFGKVARLLIRPYIVETIRRDGEIAQWPTMRLGYVLWQIAQAYGQIYAEHERWGVWGHAIGDLVFESFRLEDNIGHIGIGS